MRAGSARSPACRWRTARRQRPGVQLPPLGEEEEGIALAELAGHLAQTVGQMLTALPRQEAATEPVEDHVEDRVDLEDLLQHDADPAVVAGQEEMHEGERVARAPVAGQYEHRLGSDQGDGIGGVGHDDLETEAASGARGTRRESR